MFFFYTTASVPSILAYRSPTRQCIVQQLINNKIIHSEADSDYNYLTKFNSITPYCTKSTITPIDCSTLRPCKLYTTWFLYRTTPFVYSKKQGARARHKKTHPTPHTMCHRHRPPHLTKSSPHTCKYKSCLLPIDPHSPSPHITTQYLYVPYGLQNRLSNLREQAHRVTLPESRKLTFQPTTPPDFRNSAPLPPHGPLFITR